MARRKTEPVVEPVFTPTRVEIKRLDGGFLVTAYGDNYNKLQEFAAVDVFDAYEIMDGLFNPEVN